MIIERFALFAILAPRIVMAIVADSAGHSSRSLVNRLVKVARGSVIVARPTGVRLFADRGFPRQIVVKVLAILAVQSFGVVSALASAVDHVLFVGDSGQRQTSGSVSVAGAGSANHHILDGVVIFLANLGSIVEQIVAQCM